LDVAKGLTYLHSLLLLDIKSPNILLNREAAAKISDVGMSKAVGKSDANTRGPSPPLCLLLCLLAFWCFDCASGGKRYDRGLMWH